MSSGKLSPLPGESKDVPAITAAAAKANPVPPSDPLSDAAPDVLLLASTDGIVRSANSRARQIIGRNPVGMRVVDLFGVWAVAGFGDLVARPPEQPQEVEAPLFSTNGEAHGFLWLIRAAGKGQVALAGREMQHVYPLDLLRRLSERVDELRDANRAKQDLLDMVAHEFKTPLTVIKGYAWLLAQDGAELDAEQTAEALSRIQLGADRLLQLFEEVFIVSQIDAGHITVHPAEFDATVLLGETCDGISVLGGTHRVTLDVPPSVVFVQDPSKISQIVTNLVTNAIKYAPPGSGIRVSLAGGPQKWEVRVFNEHEGLTAEDIDALFERFSRLDRDIAVEGRGLGLYIARNLARKLCGEIRVESTPGVGVTFVFEFPTLALQG
jgi:signal transduction histidine kinase